MQSVNTSELTGAALDWAVAKCEGGHIGVVNGGVFFDAHDENGFTLFEPSTDWAQGGPIIEREKITVLCAEGAYSSKLRGYKTYWIAERGHQRASEVYGSQGDNWGTSFQIANDEMTGPTPLIAAMRCYVASELGDKSEVPKELLNV